MSTPDPSEALGAFYSQEEVRLFDITGVVAILDSPYYDFSNTKFKYHNPVVVKDFSRKKIGFGNIFIENNKLLVKMSIDYHSPDRLDIENKVPVYVACFGGLICDTPQGAIDFYGKKRSVTELIVYSLFLSHKKPSDSRILPLNEPILL